MPSHPTLKTKKKKKKKMQFAKRKAQKENDSHRINCSCHGIKRRIRLHEVAFLQLYALIHFYTNEPLQCYSRIDLFSNQR
jgi:hypothetical protein